MGKRTLSGVSCATLLLLAPLAGCGGDDDGGDGERDGDRNPDAVEESGKVVDGTFVAELPSSRLLAVVASPAVEGQDRRDVTVYVCDARRLCEWASGSSAGNSFEAASEEGEAEAKGKVSRKAATGVLELPGGDPIRYRAERATASAGVYTVTVSAGGKMRGSSAAGVGVTGSSTLPGLDSGSVKLADGTRVPFVLAEAPGAGGVPVRQGEIRMIVLADGELRGAGKTRPAGGGEPAAFFIRSSK